MQDMSKIIQSADALEKPAKIGTQAYLSTDYAAAERDRLFRKVWLQAGRLEDMPNVGDFITFDIMDDSIIIVREKDNTLRAFHNVCVHRGRRLVDTPSGKRNAVGNRKNFICGFHGWTYDLAGQCTYIARFWLIAGAAGCGSTWILMQKA
jgi:phenylpropionate dioxygenase-like ring-hydroxylating dioxygenase large terminal subunit